MIRRLLLLTTLGVMLSGCFMVPMAFVGPAVSGFSTTSIAQSAISTGASYMVKKSTGKTIAEHAFDVIGGEILKDADIFKQTYLPTDKETKLVDPKRKTIK